MAEEVRPLTFEDLDQVEQLPPPAGIMCSSAKVMLYVLTLMKDRRVALRSRVEAEKDTGGTHLRNVVLQECLCNADGTQAFPANFFEIVKKISNDQIERVYRAACNANGIDYYPTVQPKKK